MADLPKGELSAGGTIFGSLIAQAGPRGKTGEKGTDGYTPKKGIDYFTKDEIGQIVNDVIDSVNEVITPEEKKRQDSENSRVLNEKLRQERESIRIAQEATRVDAENLRNSNEENRKNNEGKRIESEEVRKQNEISRQNDFETKMQTVDESIEEINDMTEQYNNNAQEKTTEFNNNATNKTNTYNTNATVKQKAFDDNVTNKTTTFNNNTTTKTNEFNQNATDKLKEYNDNATDKINKYDEHVAEKTEKDKLQDEEIETIKQKDTSQDKLILELQKENASLKEENKNIKNQFPTGTASGNVIHLEDSSDLEFDWKLRGGSKQKFYLPEGYTQLEYIESSGTQYIDTGYKANQKTEIEVEFSYSYRRDTSNGFALGSRISSTEQNVSITCDPNDIYIGRGKTYKQIQKQTKLNEKNKIKLNEKNIIINETTINEENNFGNENGIYNIFLFACNQNGTAFRDFYGKIYNCKIFDNKELVRNFIPCRRDSDKVIGMYDLVNNVFYLNGGTGSFIAGSEQQVSPNSPSKIETVEGGVEIYECNKNEFDKNNENLITKAYLSPNDKKYVLSPYAKSIVLKCKPNTTYSISRTKILAKDFVVATCENYPQDETIMSSVVIAEYKLNASITSNNNDNYLIVYFMWSTASYSAEEILSTIQIEQGIATDYIEHQEDSVIMPIQKEMLEGDWIDDKEYHGWNKVVLDGTESWKKSARTEVNRYYITKFNNGIFVTNEIGVKCNHLKAISQDDSDVNKIGISGYNGVGFMINFALDDVDFDTLDKFKAYLVEQYAKGTPVVIYYLLAEPEILELTEEQKQAREKILKTYKNITNISVDNELASLDVTYKKDLETIINNINKAMIGG